MSSVYIDVIFKTIILGEEASLVAQLVRNLPAMRETWVQSLGWEGILFLDKWTVYCSILAWSCTNERLSLSHISREVNQRDLKAHFTWSGKMSTPIDCDRLSMYQLSSVAQLCSTLCDAINRSMPGLPVHHQLPESTQTHVHRVSDAIQPSHPLSSPSPPALNLSQYQSLFKWVSSPHQVAKVLEFQWIFQWIFRTDLL